MLEDERKNQPEQQKGKEIEAKRTELEESKTHQIKETRRRFVQRCYTSSTQYQ